MKQSYAEHTLQTLSDLHFALDWDMFTDEREIALENSSSVWVLDVIDEDEGIGCFIDELVIHP